MSRSLFFVLLVCSVLYAMIPQSSFASGTPLKGSLIVRAGQGTGDTGDCLCEWIWYTVGVKPGTLTLTARFSNPRRPMASVWSMSVVVLHGSDVAGSKTVTCSATRPICKPLARVTIHVHRRTILYIRMEGRAAEGIPYILRISGPIVALRCNQGKC